MSLAHHELEGANANPARHLWQKPSKPGRVLLCLFALSLETMIVPPPSGAASGVMASAPLTAIQDQYPSISPDGTKIVFESNRAGPPDQIFVLTIATGIVTQLTHSVEQNETPVWSPDGTKILFARRVADTPRSSWDVFVMNADGSNATNLTNSPGHDDHPRYTPDGRKILFNSARVTDFKSLTQDQLENGGYNYEIYIMDADGSAPKRLTNYHEWDTFPSMSPDGKTLLWRRILPTGGASESGLNSELFVANADGQNPQNLSQHRSFDGYPVWSPDGSMIAFSSNRDGAKPIEFNIYMMDLKTKRVKRLTETITDVEQVRPEWSPDGKKIYYNRDLPNGYAEVHVVDVPQ